MATANAAGLYRPRRPERTVLYRVLAQHFEHFVQVYDERFAPTHGPRYSCRPEYKWFPYLGELDRNQRNRSQPR